MNFTFSVKDEENTKKVPKNRFTEPSVPENSYLKDLNLKLKSQEDEFDYDQSPQRFTYYQISGFVVDNEYSVRKMIYNGSGELVEFKTKSVKAKKIREFVKKCPKNRFSVFPVHDLENTELPDTESILIAMSPILNNSKHTEELSGLMTN